MTGAPERPRRPPFRRRPLGRVVTLVEAGLFLLAVLPFLLIPADWQIRAFGAVGRLLLPRSAALARVREGLALAGRDADAARAIAAEVGDNFGRVLAEYIRMPAVRRRADRRRASGIEHLRAALAGGRGAVIVSAHFGNWEAIRLAALDAGIEVALIYRAFNNPAFDRLAMLRIGLAGEPVLHKGGAGKRAMLAHLKTGGALLILVDQRMTGGADVDFLGRPAPTATAVAAMAARFRAPMIPAVAVRDATGLGFDVAFEPPVPAGPPEAMMAAVNARIAAWIEARPGQWFWLHRRWTAARALRRRTRRAAA